MKTNSLQIISLIKEKEFLEQKIKNLLYGSIEIRERANKKYIFVHFRDGNKLVTKYAGEYSEYLLRLINQNSLNAKQIKSQLRKINKSLAELGYNNTPLSNNSQKYIDYIKDNKKLFIQSILHADKSSLYIDEIDSTLNGQSPNLSPKDVMKIMNLNNAIDFVLSPYILSNIPDYNILLSVNKFIEDGFIFSAGSLRTTPYITNGRYVAPEIPSENKTRNDLADIIKNNANPVDQAIETLLYIIKHKLFLFGNKRTALVFANTLLISQGEGVLLIPTTLSDEFKKLYIEYRDNNNDDIKSLIKNKCIVKL